MLVDKQNGNVLALAGELVKGSFDGRGFRLGIDDQEVLLAVRRLGYMLQHSSGVHSYRIAFRVSIAYAYAREQHARASVLRPVSFLQLAVVSTRVVRTSSPMTARNCLSLYWAAGAAMLRCLGWPLS